MTTTNKINHAIGKLNKAALELAITAIQEDSPDTITMLGLNEMDDKTLSTLSLLNVHQLSFAEDFRGQLVDARLNTRGLNLYLDMAIRKQRERDLENQAIRAGMRQFMMQRLTGMSRREYESRLKLLGLPGHDRGRIELLTDEEEAQVFSAWKRLSSDSAEVYDLEKFCQLFDDTGISLDRAYQSVEQLRSTAA